MILCGEDYIWYASYGSNILEERFLCYIRGGQPDGSSKAYEGCSNPSFPINKQPILISGELYFAKESKSWGHGGVGFLKTDTNSGEKTFGRMYLVTKEQFIDVVKQENGGKYGVTIDFGKAIKDGTLIFKEGAWYGKLLYLGKEGGYPIFTFTNQSVILPTTKPSEHYLKIIIRGLQETYDCIDQEGIVDYLITKQGVAGNYSRENLEVIFDS